MKTIPDPGFAGDDGSVPAEVRAALTAYDAVLISTDHSTYDYPFIVKHARLVIDTRNACQVVRAGRNKIVKA